MAQCMGKVTSIRWHMAHSHNLFVFCCISDRSLWHASQLDEKSMTLTGLEPAIPRSKVPYPLGHKATLIFVIGFITRPSTFRCQKYWIHPHQWFSNRYSKFLIIPHGLSREECNFELAPYQGNVFLHWLGIRGKSVSFFLAHYKEKFFLHYLIRGKSFSNGSVYGESHFN